jgi:peptidoglycan/xylan/chitin deacetylase (PgdA/CDA1 family)
VGNRHRVRIFVDVGGLDRRTLFKAGLVIGASVVLDGCSQQHHSVGEQQESSSPARSQPAQAGSTDATIASSSAPSSSSTLSRSVEAAPPISATPAPATSVAPAPSTTRPLGPAIEVVRGSASVAAVALTFHGAGDPALATRLLAEVESAGSRVSVLAVGQWLQEQPQMAARILDGGHDLGNHTYRHLTMPSLSASTDDSEITRCADVLRQLTGSPGRWFRPSGTDHATPTILASAGRAGYSTSVSYDVDPLDYDDPGAVTITERVLARVVPGSIVSLHFGHAETEQAIPAILDGLRSRGLAAVTLTALLDGKVPA